MYNEIDKFIDGQSNEWVDTSAGMHNACRDEHGKKLSVYRIDGTARTENNGKTAALSTSVYVALGGKCCVCGEDDWNVLEIDHINNDGAEERRSHKTGQTAKYRMLRGIIKNGGQGRYQLLCGNCHSRKTAKEGGYDKNLNKPV